MGTTSTKPHPPTLYGQPLPENWRELVVPDPNRPGPDRWRVMPNSIAVWAIVGHLQALGDEFTANTIAQTADDFRVPISAVTTALAYYEENREAIDTLLAINAAAVA
jgi:hypothetical protein